MQDIEGHVQEKVQYTEGSVQEEGLVPLFPEAQKYHLATAKVQVHFLWSLQSSTFHKVYNLDTHLLILAVLRYFFYLTTFFLLGNHTLNW